jgi:peptidoglycan/LPS O-acetylase OafA/YrhL
VRQLGVGSSVVKLLYALLAAAILALGLLHMATTFRLSSSPVAKVWFFGAGMAITFGGILNFLNRRYGLGASGLRAACIGANVLMVCFAVVAGRVTGASAAERAVLLSVLISALILSVVRSASIGPQAP